MLYKSCCALLLIISSIAFADQYKFSPFAQSKQNLPLRQLFTLPNACYINGSGSGLLDRLAAFKQRDRTDKDSSHSVRELIKQQKGLLSLNTGYALDKQSSVELHLSSSILPANFIPSLVYKQDHLYSINKLIISAEGGLFVPIIWEAVRDNISRKETDSSDSASIRGRNRRKSIGGRSSSRPDARAKSKLRSRSQQPNRRYHVESDLSDSASTVRTRNKSRPNARAKSQLSSQSYYTKHYSTPTAYEHHGSLGLIGSINARYPLDPMVYIEGGFNLSYLPPKNKAKRTSSVLPFGLIGSVQVGIHVVLA